MFATSCDCTRLSVVLLLAHLFAVWWQSSWHRLTTSLYCIAYVLPLCITTWCMHSLSVCPAGSSMEARWSSDVPDVVASCRL